MAYDYDKLRRQLAGKTYNQIGKLLTSGRIDEGALRYYYSRARKTALQRIRRASGTDVAFRNPPTFRTLRQIVTTSDLVHEVADVNRFLSGATTVTARRAKKTQTINTLHKRGLTFINQSNFDLWGEFMQWARAANVLTDYDSEGDEIELAFESAGDNASLSDVIELFEAVTGRVLS